MMATPLESFTKAIDRAEQEREAKRIVASDREIVDEINRIIGMQNQRGDLLARIYVADEIVKLRRRIKELEGLIET